MRRLAWGMCVACLMLALPAQATSVQERELRYQLGEPLSVEVDVLLDGASPIEPRISLAKPADYARHGLDAPPRDGHFRLEVSELSLERRRVHIRSLRPLNDPVVVLLLSVEQGHRRLLHEIPLILDLPGTARPEAGPVAETASLRTAPRMLRFRLSQTLDSLQRLPHALDPAPARRQNRAPQCAGGDGTL